MNERTMFIDLELTFLEREEDVLGPKSLESEPQEKFLVPVRVEERRCTSSTSCHNTACGVLCVCRGLADAVLPGIDAHGVEARRCLLASGSVQTSRSWSKRRPRADVG